MSTDMQFAVDKAKGDLIEQYLASIWYEAKDLVEGLNVASLLSVALIELEARGWRLVPVEATPAQERAAMDRPTPHIGTIYQDVYRAMVAAAPRMEDAQ